MQERRKLERFDLSAPARVVVEFEGGEIEEFNLTTKDLSSDGAYLFTPQKLPEGATVKLEISLTLDALQKLTDEKGRAKIRVKGKVIRVDGDGAAIRFASSYKITALEIGD